LHAFGESLKEGADVLDFHAHALVAAGIVAPGLLEVLEVLLEARQRVVLLNKVLAELLDDDQHEQVQHDMRHHQDERQEEQRG